jgi:hypothetical protein
MTMADRSSRPIDNLFRRVGLASALLEAAPGFAIPAFVLVFVNEGLGIVLLGITAVIQVPLLWMLAYAHRCSVCRRRQRQRGPPPWTCRKCGRIGWERR